MGVTNGCNYPEEENLVTVHEYLCRVHPNRDSPLKTGNYKMNVLIVES